MSKRVRSVAVLGLLVVAGLAVSPAAGQATFRGIGELPAGGDPYSAPEAISADGRVVVGRSNPPGGFCCAAFRWSSATGMQPLPDLSGGPVEGSASAVSGDGRIVVGVGHTGVTKAVVWTASGVPVALPELPGGGSGGSVAWGVSGDGVLIVGSDHAASGKEAFIYNLDTGDISGLGDLPGGAFESVALGISADGQVVVGSGTSAQGEEAMLWTAAKGMEGLGDFPGGDFESSALAADATGDVIVGYGTTADGRRAFRWTHAGGMQLLGSMPGATTTSATAVSANGAVVVGGSVVGGESEAFIWTLASGRMLPLADLLAEQGADLTGWRLTRAMGISADGSVLTGIGINPVGLSEGWVATMVICRPDLNGDGAVDFFDFLEFQNLFAAGDPRADFTGDGVLDFFDFLAFQQAVAEGCH